MGILNIQPATRSGAHLLIQLFGASQSGKTYSALQLARGIVGDQGRIGGMCTESGRMRLYADKVPGGFHIGELSAPFTPGRYRQAIGEFIRTGVDILVIDSFSHVWEGTGGVLDMADAAATANGKPLQGLAKWLEPKKQYRKLLQLLMQSSIHIVFCSRAKQPMLERLNANGKPEFYPGPWKPVQDKALRYEMTIVLPMIEDGRYDTRPRDELGAALFKCPSDLRRYFDGSPPTVELGRKIAEWVGGVKTIDSELEQLLMDGQSAAVEGSEAYRAWAKNLKNLTTEHKAELGRRRENWESQAAAADAEKARLAELALDASEDERAWRTEALEIMSKAESLKPGSPEAGLYARSRGVEEFLGAYAAFVATGNHDHEKILQTVQTAVAALTPKG